MQDDTDLRFINPVALQNFNQKKQREQDEFRSQLIDQLHRLDELQLIQFSTDLKNIIYPEMKKVKEEIKLLELESSRERIQTIHNSHKISVIGLFNLATMISVLGMLIYLTYKLR
jgi:hypothetical protein